MDQLQSFARRIPKAELHLHIEGTLEPEMMFSLAARNDVPLRFNSVEAVRAAYEFDDLQAFLDIYYEGANVLLSQQDFYDLAWAYFERAQNDGVRRAEIFFDPQTHTDRGVPFATVIDGLYAATRDAEVLGIDADLIMCFLRHLPAESAMATLQEALPHKDKFIAVGLDSSEKGHPPSKFVDVYDAAKQAGLRAVAHAGEEGPAAYVEEALDLLGVSRIDHGIRALEDPALVSRLVAEGMPLTVCPLSNVKLRVVDHLSEHPLPAMMDAGLKVTINSDDPAYFGGYVGENFAAVVRELGLGHDEITTLARNSFDASFVDHDRRAYYQASIDEFITANQSV